MGLRCGVGAKDVQLGRGKLKLHSEVVDAGRTFGVHRHVGGIMSRTKHC